MLRVIAFVVALCTLSVSGQLPIVFPGMVTPPAAPTMNVTFTVSMSLSEGAFNPNTTIVNRTTRSTINAAYIVSQISGAVAAYGVPTPGMVISLVRVAQFVPFDSTEYFNGRFTVLLAYASISFNDPVVIDHILRYVPANLGVQFSTLNVAPVLVDFRNPNDYDDNLLRMIGPFLGMSAGYVLPLLVIFVTSIWRRQTLNAEAAYAKLDNEFEKIKHEYILLKGEVRVMKNKAAGIVEEDDEM